MIEFKSTLKEQPISLLVYGKDGVGKSTLAAHSSRPVFIASESGLSNIDTTACFPTTWSEVLEAVDTATSMSVCDHIVIDSLDWIEPMIWKHVCEVGDDKGKKNMAGVTIGDGAVIGPNAVVFKDVEPYAVVRGNPAEFVRYRHKTHAIRALLRIAWWDWPPELIRERIDAFYYPVDDFIQRYG